jgi:hypothetical protein
MLSRNALISPTPIKENILRLLFLKEIQARLKMGQPQAKMLIAVATKRMALCCSPVWSSAIDNHQIGTAQKRDPKNLTK